VPGLTGWTREAAIAAALHVASRLKDPADAERAAAAAATQSQFAQFVHWSPSSIAQGNAGLGVLWAYLDACFPNEGWDLVGRVHLELAARAAERSQWIDASMFSGFAGVGFAAWQLSRGGTRYRRLLASFDEAVARETVQNAARVRASDQISVGDFDVISGLSGVGAYLVCRRDQPAIDVALANAVDALACIVSRDRTPPAWYTPVHLLYDDATREMYPHGNLNCGLAHGVPGILAFLSLARLKGGSSPALDEAIGTVADWLLANRLDDEWGVNWPAAVPLQATRSTNGDVTLRAADPATAPGGPGRAAWCYGAPGIARALWLAGRAMDRADYLTVAISTMEAVFRRPIPARMIDSPTFCHGVAGLLAITLRFAADTGDAQFAVAAEGLTQQILGRFERDSLLGFRNLEYRGNETDQPGLLDGAAGVAIVLLAAATGVEPTWDRAFLLS